MAVLVAVKVTVPLGAGVDPVNSGVTEAPKPTFVIWPAAAFVAVVSDRVVVDVALVIVRGTEAEVAPEKLASPA